MTRWFWLSFVDTQRPVGEHFLGVIVMPVTETAIELLDHLDDSDRFDHMSDDDKAFTAAAQLAAFLQINPGGEVKGYEITDDIHRVPADQRGRLLSAEEIERTKLGRSE